MQNWHQHTRKPNPKTRNTTNDNKHSSCQTDRRCTALQLGSSGSDNRHGCRSDSLQVRREDGAGIITHAENAKGLSERGKFRYENRPSELVDHKSEKNRMLLCPHSGSLPSHQPGAATSSKTAGSRTHLGCQNPGCAACHMLAQTCFPDLMQACRALFLEPILSSGQELQQGQALQLYCPTPCSSMDTYQQHPGSWAHCGCSDSAVCWET